MNQPNTIVTNPAALDHALTCARGTYQRGLLLGDYCLSGADLRGTAKSYAYWYARSRANLLARMTAAGVPWHTATGKHGKHILVVGANEDTAVAA